MIRRIAFLPVLALILIGCAADSGTSPAPKKAASNKEDGFVSLFNGKDLTGWIYGTSNGKTSKAGQGYQVRDGVIYCTVKDGGNLFTEKEYGDFAFRFEFKLTPGANNGIAIRAPLEGNAAFLGMEVQILDDTAEQYRHLRPEQYHGSVYDTFPREPGHLKPVGEWNEQEIIAKGGQITIKLNGHTITNGNLDDIKDEAKLKKHPGLRNPSGHIGFMGHGAEVEFRNLRVKEL
jgi:hypothetical protein